MYGILQTIVGSLVQSFRLIVGVLVLDIETRMCIMIISSGRQNTFGKPLSLFNVFPFGLRYLYIIDVLNIYPFAKLKK